MQKRADKRSGRRRGPTPRTHSLLAIHPASRATTRPRTRRVTAFTKTGEHIGNFTSGPEQIGGRPCQLQSASAEPTQQGSPITTTVF